VGFNNIATWTRLTHRKESQPETLQLCWIEMCDGSIHEFPWIFDSLEKRFYDPNCELFFDIDEVSRWAVACPPPRLEKSDAANHRSKV
jgi:hypothetical protein